MSDNVRVELRHVVLAEAAAVQEHAGGRMFVALDEPPPVRSVLALKGGTSKRAIEVVRVVEVPEGGGTRGVHGRVVDDEALARFAAVGTERLPGGAKDSNSAQASADSTASDAESSSTQLAMPAPVVVVEDMSEPISLVDDDGSDDEGGDTNEGGTKKRKGRKRR